MPCRVEAANHEDLAPSGLIEQCVRESAQEHAADIAMNHGGRLGQTFNRCQGCIHGSAELVAQTVAPPLIPCVSLSEIGLGLRRETDAHSCCSSRARTSSHGLAADGSCA